MNDLVELQARLAQAFEGEYKPDSLAATALEVVMPLAAERNNLADALEQIIDYADNARDNAPGLICEAVLMIAREALNGGDDG